MISFLSQPYVFITLLITAYGLITYLIFNDYKGGNEND